MSFHGQICDLRVVENRVKTVLYYYYLYIMQMWKNLSNTPVFFFCSVGQADYAGNVSAVTAAAIFGTKAKPTNR